MIFVGGAKGRFLGFFSGKYSALLGGYGRGVLTSRLAVLINAAFAFIGTEITAIAAAETSNVSETLDV